MYLPDRMTDKYMAKLSFHILEQLIDASIKRLGYDCRFCPKKNKKIITQKNFSHLQGPPYALGRPETSILEVV